MHSHVYINKQGKAALTGAGEDTPTHTHPLPGGGLTGPPIMVGEGDHTHDMPQVPVCGGALPIAHGQIHVSPSCETVQLEE